MKKRYLFFFFALCILGSFAAKAQKANLKIKIVDAENLSLPGASVRLSPGQFSAVSNQSGEAVIAAVSAGKYTMEISYIGFETVKKEIQIGQSSVIITEKMTPRLKSEKAVVVIGDRLKGQSKALNQQKNSDNITNYISADQIGRFPDNNIGDALKRVPGITMQNDQGEARNIIVRGMGPELNSVALNGERVPSAEGDNRRVQLDLIPADMIQTIEVNKTLTASLDADAIGGSVNLITRSAPNALRVSATIAGGYNVVREGFIGTAAFILGNRFAKGKLGFIINGSYNKNEFGSDNVETVWGKTQGGKLFIADHDIRVYDVTRERRSLAATLDYKISEFHTITVGGSYNWRDDLENRFRLRHRYRGNTSNPAATDLAFDGDGNIASYKNGEVIRQTKAGINNNRNENRRLEDQRTQSLALSGNHVFGKLKSSWNIQYAKASEKRPNERYLAMGRRSITVFQDISNAKFPLATDTTSLSRYTRLSEFSEENQDQYERDVNAKLDFSVPVNLFVEKKGTLKFGARLRTKKKVRDNNFFSFSPKTAFLSIESFPLVNKTNSSFYPGEKFAAGSFITPAYVGGINLDDANAFTKKDEPSEYIASNYSANENIIAGYVELKQPITEKIGAIIGLRTETTYVDYTGNIVEDDATLKGTSTLKNNYTDVLPNLNLKYAFTKTNILRAALTFGIARPKYYDLVPYINLNPNDKELSVGNSNLAPLRATNVDIMWEQYHRSIGILSAGVFYKNINKFFYTYINDNYLAADFVKDFPTALNPIAADEKWSFTQRRNGSGAQVFGLEAAIQRQFNFLPGFWKGFGIYLNYTHTYSKAKGLYDAAGELIRSNVKLPGAAPNVFNASMSYENKKVVVRVSGNYTSAYVDDDSDGGYNADSFFDRYYDKQFFLDANFSFAFTKSLRLFGEANNLTNQPLRYYQGVKERTAQVEYYGPKFNLGIKFDIAK